MSTTAEPRAVPFPAVDPSRNQLILCVGRKGSGKSHHARALFRAWPDVDKLVIDPTGDADPGDDLEPLVIRGGPPPAEMPKRRDNGLAVVRYIANPGSKTYRDDVDNALAMALYPKRRRTLTWIDEVGRVMPANQTGPHGTTLLDQSRHWNASAIFCCPRPLTINPLIRSQADRVVMFDIPNPDDRDVLAKSIGWPPKDLHDKLDRIARAGDHWFLIFDAADHVMYECPPLPPELSA